MQSHQRYDPFPGEPILTIDNRLAITELLRGCRQEAGDGSPFGVAAIDPRESIIFGVERVGHGLHLRAGSL